MVSKQVAPDLDEDPNLEEEIPDETEVIQEEAEFEYNNREEESWKKQKIDPDTWPDNMVGTEEHRFLREVDLSKGPIIWEVDHIWRVKAIDIFDKMRKRKEYIWATVNWYGKNRLGLKCAPVMAHVEGYYNKITSKPDGSAPEEGQPVRRIFAGQEPCYYIRFTKKNVDALIARSHGTDKETIKFGVKGPAGLRTDTFTYEQFVSWSWEECLQALHTKGGPMMLPSPKVD